jgi:hypothetical protein
VLWLTDAQVALLIAMNGPARTHAAKGYVWIERRRYELADLYALRAAGLVRGTGIRRGARGFNGFELTDRGGGPSSHVARPGRGCVVSGGTLNRTPAIGGVSPRVSRVRDRAPATVPRRWVAGSVSRST